MLELMRTAEEAARRQRQTDEEARLAAEALREAQQGRLALLEEDARSSASRVWLQSKALREIGGESACDAVATFEERYAAMTVSLEGGPSRPVEIPEVIAARGWLRSADCGGEAELRGPEAEHVRYGGGAEEATRRYLGIPTGDEQLICKGVPRGREVLRIVRIRAKDGYLLVALDDDLPMGLEAPQSKTLVSLDARTQVFLPLVPRGTDCYFVPRQGGYRTITISMFTGSPSAGLQLKSVRTISGVWAGSDVRGRMFDGGGSSMPASLVPMTRWLLSLLEEEDRDFRGQSSDE